MVSCFVFRVLGFGFRAPSSGFWISGIGPPPPPPRLHRPIEKPEPAPPDFTENEFNLKL